MQPREVQMCDASGNQFYAIVHWYWWLLTPVDEAAQSSISNLQSPISMMNFFGLLAAAAKAGSVINRCYKISLPSARPATRWDHIIPLPLSPF